MHLNYQTTTGLFTQNITLRRITILLLLLLGLGIRLLDLTDPPLDIHPTRQLHSALMARGMYYQGRTDVPEWQVTTAVRQWKREAVIEPPIMENLTVDLYKVAGGEFIWIARILSSIFWVAGGLAIYLLASQLTNADGGVTALIFYLFQTYGVMASRTFQPDPLMVSLIIFSWWSFLRWLQKPDWKWTIIAGLITGAAIYVKNVSIFFLVIPYIVLVFRKDIKTLLKNNKVWVLAIVALLPMVIYTIYGTFVAGFLGQQFSFRIFPNLWLDISNYSRWMGQIKDTVGVPALILGLVGIFLFEAGQSRKWMLGLWLGYVIYGFTFAYHIGTHDYYQLPLIPILALSIAPLGPSIISRILSIQTWKYIRPALYGLSMAIVLTLLWQNRNILTSQDYRAEPAFWQSLGDRLRDVSVIGLTEDYGYRIAYYGWDSIDNWPGTGDIAVRKLAGRPEKEIQTLIEKDIKDKKYFLVTWFEDYARQPELKTYLEKTYPVETGEGYLLFDIGHPY
jgi:4-amino-4-deoxy-L-arabinose transferase-like glycosyltransferase